MEPLGGDFEPNDEVDDVRWVPADRVRDVLTYGRDADIVDQLTELLPESAKVFVPPQETNSKDYWSYGHHSSQIYGFAYQALNRRMKMIGVEIPGPEELMPGPCDFTGLDERSRIDLELA